MSGITLNNALITPARFEQPQFRLTGAVYDESRRLAPQSLRVPTPRWRHVDAPAYCGPEPEQRLPEAVFLGHFFTHSGHFLIETLASFVHADTFRSELPLLFQPWRPPERTQNWSNTPYVRNLVEGVDPDRIAPVVDPMTVSRLHIPPRPFILGQGAQPDSAPVMARARNECLELAAPVQPFRQIYRSRRSIRNATRVTANEVEVEQEFARRGFTILQPERLPIHRQVVLAAGAQTLAGLDGSALHLSMFQERGSREIIVRTHETGIVTPLNEAFGIESCVIRTAQSVESEVGTLTTIDMPALGRALDRIDSGGLERNSLPVSAEEFRRRT